MPEKSSPYYTSQLGNAVTMAAKEDQVLWTIFGVFFAANLLILSSFGKGESPFTFMIAIVALVMAVVWHRIQSRALGHLIFLETMIQRLESEYLNIETTVTISGRLNTELYCQTVGGGIKARDAMRWTAISWIIIWLVTLSYFVSGGA